MIQNEGEFEGARERIAYFQELLQQLRVTAAPEEFPFVASGYRVEIERMQSEVLEYLTRHTSEREPAQAA